MHFCTKKCSEVLFCVQMANYDDKGLVLIIRSFFCSTSTRSVAAFVEEMARCCQRSRAHPQDGAWSWLVCVCSAIAAAIVVGFSTTFGVFLPHLINHFQTGRERTGKSLKKSIQTEIFQPQSGCRGMCPS